MQAWQLEDRNLDALQLRERAQPQPGPREVLVRVRAASLNYRDLAIATGIYGQHLPLPFVPVSDGAGEVAAVGTGVERWQVGDRVIGHYTSAWLAGRFDERYHASKLGGPLDGMAQPYIVLPETALVATPAGLSDQAAATLPIAAVTAWNGLRDIGVAAGDTVLVQGSGGVSLFALQLARALGARVIATTTRAAKAESLLALGASDVVVTRDLPDWGTEVWRRTGGVDAVVDVGGNVSLPQSLAAIRSGGSIAAVGFLGGFDAPPDISLPLLVKRARIFGQSVGHRESFEAMNRAIEHHQLQPVIDRVFPFAELPAAFAYLNRGDVFGKIVIAID